MASRLFAATVVHLAICWQLSLSGNIRLPCHCQNGSMCQENGYCANGCERGWFGPGCQISNVALGKIASQSSTFYEPRFNYWHIAGLAVDGQMSGFMARYCSHTDLHQMQGSAWWSVVLDTEKYYVITNIIIVNRNDTYQKRLTNFKILYSNETEGNPDPSNSSWQECVHESGVIGMQRTYTCDNTAIAKRVAVYLTTEGRNNPSTVLTLCEVQIYGYQRYDCSDEYTGPGCLLRHCDPNTCDQGCDEFNGCRSTFCSDSGYLPPDCWIRLPSLRDSSLVPTRTCNSIGISNIQLLASGDLSISSVALEVKSASYNHTFQNLNIANDFVNISISSIFGETYSFRILPLCCNESSGACYFGPSSNWTTVTTESLHYSYVRNNSCLRLDITNEIPFCDRVALMINCTSHYNNSLVYYSNNSTLCHLPDGSYRCSFLATLNGTVVYQDIADVDIVLCAARTIPRHLGLRNDPAGYLVGEELVDAYCTEKHPLITWRCTSTSAITAEWIAVRNGSCPRNKDMERLSRVNVTYATLSSYLSEVINVTSSSLGATFGVAVADVSHGSQILNNAISLVIQEPQRVVIADVVITVPALVSKILEAPSESLAASNTSSSISRNVEAFLTASTTVLQENSTVMRVEPNLVVQMTSDPAIVGIEVISDSTLSEETVKPVRTGDSQSSQQQADAAVYFAPEAKDVRKSFAVFNNSKLFQGKKMYPAIDRILAAQLTETVLHPELVTVHFKLPAIHDETASYDEVVCGYWNYLESDWSTFGCKRKHAPYNRISCSCNHTTNFAVLFRIHETGALKVDHSFALSTITRVGLSLSVALLLVVIISFLLLRTLRRTQAQKVLFNVSLSICLLDASFLIGIERTGNEAACIAFAALIHFFLLTSFAWMSVEASLHYLKLVKIFGAMPSHFFIKAAMPAWGLPAVAVSSLLIADYRLYDTTQDGICWIQRSVMQFSVILPVSLCIAYNGIIFAMIARSLFSTHSQSVRSTMGKSERLKLRTRASFAVFVLMGLTWTFGYFALQGAETAFNYLFCLFNSIQGALIALLHCLLGKLLPRELRRIFRRASSSQEQSSGFAASTGTFKTSINQRNEKTKL